MLRRKNQVTEHIITLHIDRLAGLGDATGLYNGKKVFVPYGAQNDTVRARIVRETADALHARIETVLTPGESRIAPVCGHFGTCGGCSLQHINAATYREFKYTMATEAARKAGFGNESLSELIVMPPRSRRRAEFKAESGTLGFLAAGSHSIVDMQECHVLEPALFTLAMGIRQSLAPGSARGIIHINGLDEGYDVLLEGEGFNATNLANLNGIVRIGERRNGVTKLIRQFHPATLRLGTVTVEAPPGAFLQASSQAQRIMTEIVTAALKSHDKALDLFAGIGTYSFPLCEQMEVTAVEGEESMVSAMLNAAQRRKLRRFHAIRRDLFRSPFEPSELKQWKAAVINPPRAGAKAQTEALARAGMQTIVMVSCNPATFARDARLLKEAGYALKRLTPIDQFEYSAHLELVAVFQK